MQFLMSPVNPDQVIPLQTNRISTYDGKYQLFNVYVTQTSQYYFILCELTNEKYLAHLYSLYSSLAQGMKSPDTDMSE